MTQSTILIIPTNNLMQVQIHLYNNFYSMKNQQQAISLSETEKIDQAITSLKDKMKLINYNNLQPPYFFSTLTKFRETHFGKFLKNIKLEGSNIEQIRESLKIVGYIIEKFDDEYFDLYSRQLIEPYSRKMLQDNYEFDAVNFKEIKDNFHLQTEIEETLSQAAQWLTQIEITQDLLARIQLYFKLKTPNIIEKVRLEGIKSEKNSWTGSFMSGVRKLLSYGLQKGSKIAQSTFVTAILMLSLAIVSGSSLPWKATIVNPKNLLTAASIVAVPYILETIASTVQRSEYVITLKRWALTFESLASSIRKFNENLQECIRDCSESENTNQFEIERTNLQKIVHELNKKIESVIGFDQEKFEQMRERTEAYFREYIQIKEDDWTLVIPKEPITNRNQMEVQLPEIKKQKEMISERSTRDTAASKQSQNHEEYINL